MKGVCVRAEVGARTLARGRLWNSRFPSRTSGRLATAIVKKSNTNGSVWGCFQSGPPQGSQRLRGRDGEGLSDCLGLRCLAQRYLGRSLKVSCSRPPNRWRIYQQSTNPPVYFTVSVNCYMRNKNKRKSLPDICQINVFLIIPASKHTFLGHLG